MWTVPKRWSEGCAATLFFLLVGCAAPTTPPPVATAPVALPENVKSADALLADAALAVGAQQQSLYLQAAEQFMSDERWSEAQAAAGNVDINRLTSGERARLARVYLGLSIAAGDTVAASEWLAQADLDPGAQAYARAQICAREDQFACAAQELIRASRYADDPSEYNTAIWSYLQQAIALNQPRVQMTGDRISAGWWTLADLALTGDRAQVQQDNFANWRRQYSGHPAAFTLPAQLAYLTQPIQSPRHISVLLPLSGSLASAGQAVRDGFVAAYLEDRFEQKPKLTFLDTATTPTSQLYEQAIAAGSDFVVGPLLKEEVVNLSEQLLPVPTLALNYSEDSYASDNLHQFGVAIEDEARGLLDRVRADGHERILLIVSDEHAWAQRAYAVFSDNDLALTQTAFVRDATQMTSAIGDAMLVSNSQQRSRQIADWFGETMEFSPRARSDLDAVVAILGPIQAQALKPALRYHFAHRLPVYTGAQALRNNTNPNSLNGYNVTDLALFVDREGLASELREIYELSPQRAAPLYALGADAYQLSDRLAIMKSAGSSYAGATGRLSVGANNRIDRAQPWGRMEEGELKP